MVLEIWSVSDRIFLSFWIILFPFTRSPLTTWKIKVQKICSTYLEISSFYKSVPNMMIICCTVLEIWCVTDVVFIFHFGLLSAYSIKYARQSWTLAIYFVKKYKISLWKENFLTILSICPKKKLFWKILWYCFCLFFVSYHTKTYFLFTFLTHHGS